MKCISSMWCAAYILRKSTIKCFMKKLDGCSSQSKRYKYVDVLPRLANDFAKWCAGSQYIAWVWYSEGISADSCGATPILRSLFMNPGSCGRNVLHSSRVTPMMVGTHRKPLDCAACTKNEFSGSTTPSRKKNESEYNPYKLGLTAASSPSTVLQRS